MPQNDQFEGLTIGFVDQMFRLAYSRVGNLSDAEDIVQDTYLKAFRGFNRFRGNCDIKTWLTRILINTIHDHFRRRERSISTIDIGDVLEEIIAAGPIVKGREDELCDSEIDSALKKALASMPEHFVIPLLLREVYEISYEDIGKKLDIPKGTVMSRLFRARMLLRKRLLEERKTAAPPVRQTENQTDL
jgi:RNA polymerase sigma-70 factor (ECF subfamily)